MVKEIEKETFDLFAESSNQNSFFQSSFYGRYCERKGYMVEYVGFYDSEALVGAAMLLSYNAFANYRAFYVPRGFLVDYTNNDYLSRFTNEIKGYIKNKKGIYLKINPIIEFEGQALSEVVSSFIKLGYITDKRKTNCSDLESKFISRIDLKGKKEMELFTEMSVDTTEAIKASYNNSLEIKIYDEYSDDLNQVTEMLKVPNQFSGARIYANSDIEFYKEMFEIFGNHFKMCIVRLNIEDNIKNLNNQRNEIRLKIVESRANEDLKFEEDLEYKLIPIEKKLEELNKLKNEKGDTVNVSSGAFILWGDKLVNLFTVEDFLYRKYNAKYFLTFKMIKFAKVNKCSKYEFYNNNAKFCRNFDKITKRNKIFIPKEMFNDKKKIKESIEESHDFSSGFNSSVIELPGEYTLPVNKLLSRIFKKFKEVSNDRDSK